MNVPRSALQRLNPLTGSPLGWVGTVPRARSGILPAVMFPVQLSTKIQHVLRQADPNRMYRYREGTDIKAANYFREVACPNDDGVIEKRNLVVLVNEQVDYLRKLYSTAPPEHQQSFSSQLLAQLDADNAAIVAQTVLELRDTLVLFYWEQFDDAAMNFWSAVADKLALEHWDFTEEDLERIDGGWYRLTCQLALAKERELSPDRRPGEFRTIEVGRRVLGDLRRVLDRVRYLRIRDELHGVTNPAIDTDRRVLLSRLEDLGFDRRLPHALGEVERRATSATTPFDFKAAVDLLRAFFESFVQEAARRVAASGARQLPAGEPRPFATWKDYLRNAGVITTNEAELLQKLYNYLSIEGTHNLGTGLEQFNVSRVTIVEWCMMIAGRIQRHLRV